MTSIAGKYQHYKNEDIDDYFTVVGVPYMGRKMMSMSSPLMEILVDGEYLTIKSSSLLRTVENKFKLGEEYEEIMPNAKLKSVTNLINEKQLETKSVIEDTGANCGRHYEFTEDGCIVEQQVKKLKRFLEGWRMAVLPLKSVILWEQQWHPCAIVGSVSFIYFLIWLLDLNSLATFAVVGLFLNFVDFIVPVICNSLYGPSSWTEQHENIFDEVCKSIVANYNKSLHSVRQFYALRETSPYMYYILSLSLLMTLAWVASSINNTFLMYILSTTMLLMPGVQHRGIFNTLLAMVNMAPKSIKAE